MVDSSNSDHLSVQSGLYYRLSRIISASGSAYKPGQSG